MAERYRPIPYRPPRLDLEVMRARAVAFEQRMALRRSVRHFAPDPVPRDLVASAIRTASSAPSGAHRQPWTFVAVEDPALKQEIRLAAEAEERRSYEGGRMPEAWREALAPIGTDWRKPYLATVPWIVVLFAQKHGIDASGERVQHYYVRESCGLAAGLFIAALHDMGLSTLTHTPAPMTFLSRLLDRPPNEQPYILFPVGFPAADAEVPDLERKPLEAVSVWR